MKCRSYAQYVQWKKLTQPLVIVWAKRTRPHATKRNSVAVAPVVHRCWEFFVVCDRTENTSHNIVKKKYLFLSAVWRWLCPTNNALLISFWLSSDAEMLLTSTDWGYKSAPNVHAMCVDSNWASILHSTFGGWVSLGHLSEFYCTFLSFASAEKWLWLSGGLTPLSPPVSLFPSPQKKQNAALSLCLPKKCSWIGHPYFYHRKSD